MFVSGVVNMARDKRENSLPLSLESILIQNLNFTENGLFLLVNVVNSSPSSMLLISNLFLLINFVNIDWKKKAALCELRVKGEMMDVKPHSPSSRRRAAFFFSSLLQT